MKKILFLLLFQFFTLNANAAIEMDDVECLSYGWPGKFENKNPFQCEIVKDDINYWDSDRKATNAIPVFKIYEAYKGKEKGIPCNPVVFGPGIFINPLDLKLDSNLECLSKAKSKEETTNWINGAEKSNYGLLALFDIVFQRVQEIGEFGDFTDQNGKYTKKVLEHMRDVNDILTPVKRGSFDSFMTHFALILQELIKSDIKKSPLPASCHTNSAHPFPQSQAFFQIKMKLNKK